MSAPAAPPPQQPPQETPAPGDRTASGSGKPASGKRTIGTSKRATISRAAKRPRRRSRTSGKQLGSGRTQVGHSKQRNALRSIENARRPDTGKPGSSEPTTTKTETAYSQGRDASEKQAEAGTKTATTGHTTKTGGAGRGSKTSAEPISRTAVQAKQRIASKAGSVSQIAAGAAGADDGSGKAAIGKIAAEAAKGAAKGGAAGGVGAIPGALIGAGKGALKSKKGRQVIATLVLLSMFPALLLGAVLASVMSGDQMANSTQNNEWSKTQVAMSSNGYSENTIATLQDVTSAGGVQYPLVAAAAWVKGETLDLDPKTLRTPVEAVVFTDKELNGVIDSQGGGAFRVAMTQPVGGPGAEPDVVEVDLDDPIGPFGFKYDDVVKKFGTSSWTVADLVHPASAAELYSTWAGEIARKANAPDLDLGKGVKSSSTEIDSQTGRPAFGFLRSDITAARDADNQRKIWEKVLTNMPVEDAGDDAPGVYTAALQWYLGQSASCLAGADSVGVVGEWHPPLVESALPSDQQDFGPRNIGQGFHDGLDMNLKNGQQNAPIYAASDGEVILADPHFGYGPHWVKIKHAGGVETQYGHMKSTTVKVGDQVSAGQRIGVEGNEGIWSQGDHLHFSVKVNDEWTDPVKFYSERGVDIFAPAGAAKPAPVVGASPTPPAAGSGAGEGLVRIVQANVPKKKSKVDFAEAMQKTYATGPDFVSLNEIFGRPKEEYTPTGYESWRAAKGKEHEQSQSSAVTWRTDRWTKVTTGRATLIKNGPRAEDASYANWVTLKNTGALGNVSFVSTQLIANPNHVGPNKARRKELYRLGMVELRELIEQLERSGPVFVAGDFNHRATEDDSWGAEKMMAAAGYVSSFDADGKLLPTTKKGVSIDYIFGDKEKSSIANQWTESIPSDHYLLGTDWAIPETAVQTTRTLPDSFVAKGTRDGQPAEIPLDKTQLEYAAQIAQIANEVGAGANGAIIAFMTALVEGGFKNYSSDVYPATIGKEYPSGAVGSDHDSVGLFQQRPQSGWGPKVVTIAGASSSDFASDALHLIENVDYQAKAFFGGPSGPNGGSPRGLLDVAGWETLPKGEAAQTVQVSAHGGRYAEWESAASELYSLVQGGVVAGGAGACPGSVEAHYGNVPSEYNLGAVKPQTIALANLLGPMFGITTIGGYRASATDPGGHPSGLALDFMVPLTPEGKAQGDALAEYAKANAESLGIDYIIWYQRIWSSGRASEGWRPMSDRGSQTANHMDHPHINLKP